MFAELSLINFGGTLSLYIDNKKIVVEKENVPSFKHETGTHSALVYT